MAHDALLVLLKRNGPMTIRALGAELGLSETTVRHHVSRLVRTGLIELGEEATSRAGRPAALCRLTHAAEGVLPKRYAELLEAVLTAAEQLNVMQLLFTQIAESFALRLRERTGGLSGEVALRSLLDGLDYGDMLAALEPCEGGWELRAHNCLYHATGQRFVEVCDLLPAIITKTGTFCAERIACQRDGRRSCDFFISAATA